MFHGPTLDQKTRPVNYFLDGVCNRVTVSDMAIPNQSLRARTQLPAEPSADDRAVARVTVFGSVLALVGQIRRSARPWVPTLRPVAGDGADRGRPPRPPGAAGAWLPGLARYAGGRVVSRPTDALRGMLDPLIQIAQVEDARQRALGVSGEAGWLGTLEAELGRLDGLISPSAATADCKAIACTAPMKEHGWCEAHLAYWGGEP